MPLDISLDCGDTLGGHAFFDHLLAHTTLQNVVRAPGHGLAVFLPFEVLLGEATAFHPIQGSHLIEHLRALLLESDVRIRHDLFVYQGTQIVNP